MVQFSDISGNFYTNILRQKNQLIIYYLCRRVATHHQSQILASLLTSSIVLKCAIQPLQYPTSRHHWGCRHNHSCNQHGSWWGRGSRDFMFERRTRWKGASTEEGGSRGLALSGHSGLSGRINQWNSYYHFWGLSIKKLLLHLWIWQVYCRQCPLSYWMTCNRLDQHGDIYIVMTWQDSTLLKLPHKSSKVTMYHD